MLLSVCHNAFLLEVCVSQTSVDQRGNLRNNVVGFGCMHAQQRLRNIGEWRELGGHQSRQVLGQSA